MATRSSALATRSSEAAAAVRWRRRGAAAVGRRRRHTTWASSRKGCYGYGRESAVEEPRDRS